MKVYQAIAQCLRGISNPTIFVSEMWLDRLETIELKTLPSGSGFDHGCTVNVDKSQCDRIVLNTSFHHMDSNGMYDGWTDHKVILTPDFISGFSIRVTGRNKRDIKEYIAETFCHVLNADYEYTDK